MPRQAVVIGGSVAGLLAARVLTEHYGRVTVLERDRYPETPEVRRGVPQARHVHIFLTGGQRALEELLPGSDAALARAGAVRLEAPRDLLTLTPWGWQRRYHEGRHAVISCTRPLFEHVVREQVLTSCPSLEVLPGLGVTGLAAGEGSVTGVRVRYGDDERVLPADLVVDASGRGSRTPAWLADLGLPVPREESVNPRLAYASRLFRLPEPRPDHAVYIQARPDSPRGGGALPVEGGAWLVTLAGVQGSRPPTDGAGFLDFARGLRDPYLGELLAGAVPLGPVHGSHSTANVRRRYEDTPVPGLLVTGDALCTYNPVYGQGLSVAAMGAVALRDALARGADPAAAQLALARTANQAWLLASGADRPYDPASPAPSPGDRLRSWYAQRLIARATHDEVAAVPYRDVACLTAPLERLSSPRLVLRTLLLPRGEGLPHPPLEVERPRR
ncbi:FAD-dependent monooxygenase [Streptomyces sp. NPDC051940]|uniref:NAD(P)/FAD-dependent oxidoreductase n=1 Tax=Streptomyces sp. NPDC051940 TaxID=3155675 RepID=UPI003439F9FC